jgi:signal peptidase I
MNEPATTPESTMKVVREWLVVIVTALVIALTIRSFVLQQFYISGPSMEPTLFQDDRVLVNKLSYRLHDIGRGDVVVFDRVTTDGEIVRHDDLIKRVLGLPGDTVEIIDCNVFVNDTRVDEPYLDPITLSYSDFEERCRVFDMDKVTVSEGHLFVMGDNRPQSYDSRMFGEIDEDLIVGRAFVAIWPLSHLSWL